MTSDWMSSGASRTQRSTYVYVEVQIQIQIPSSRPAYPPQSASRAAVLALRPARRERLLQEYKIRSSHGNGSITHEGDDDLLLNEFEEKVTGVPDSFEEAAAV
ncbi:hypothetical protein WG66_001322 [Moniliophthora roreri]|nr:hypothetical protein WG66_001322 [Moniliophthora roreri]